MKNFALRFSLFALLVAAVAAATGCAHFRKGAAVPGQIATTPTLLVVGERVRVLRDGESLEVPPPTPPARVWYLVDNVGLAEWLGLDAPAAFDAGGGTSK